MKKKQALLMILLLCAGFGLAPLYSASVVNTSLGNALKRIFPELSEGYIDLNANKKLDRLEDMDELVAETLVQDGKLQVQEVLDFIIEQYRFFPVQKLEQISEILRNAEGEIAEIIALTYKNRIAVIIEKKKEFGSDDLYLTPSALRRAHEEMSGYIATMLHAFKKEERQFENRFSDARESLFSMIEAGYPLPSMGAENRELLVSAMVHTILTESDSNNERVRAAIGTLGRLKAESALPYLQELLTDPSYQADSAAAIGEIGNTQARSILMDNLRNSSDGDYQYSLIRALGKIGGDESAQYILGMLPDQSAAGEDSGTDAAPEREKTILKALTDMSRQGNKNRQIYTVLSSYLNHQDPVIRVTAVEGITGFGGRSAAATLLPLLKDEENEQVKIALVRNLNSLNDASTIPAFTAQLQDPAASTALKIELIQAIGENPNGPRGMLNIMDFLNSEDETIRGATRNSILKLYSKDAGTIVGGLNRGILQSRDRQFLEEATSILAEIADPASVNTLLRVLESPYPQVRKNATWAFYRIRPENNVRVVSELQKLVSSEAEPLAVRTNAVRAIGAMGFNSPQLEVHKTLLTTLKLTSPEYSMLRYFSIRELGEMAVVSPEITEALLRAASPREEKHIRIAAIRALRTLGLADQKHIEALAGIAARSDDREIQAEILRVLGDMGSRETVLTASGILEAGGAEQIYPEIAYALSRVGTPEAIDLLLDMSGEEKHGTLIRGLLQDVDSTTLSRSVNRRLQSETDPAVKEALAELQALLESNF